MSASDVELLSSNVHHLHGHGLRKLPSDPYMERHQQQQALMLQHDQLVSALTPPDFSTYEDLVDEMNKVLGKKSAISVLMEYSQFLKWNVNFVDVGKPDGPDHKPMFTMVAVVNGQPFHRVRAGSKRECRAGAAYLAWKSLVQVEQDKYAQMLRDENLSVADHMVLLAHYEYCKQVEQNPNVFSGKKVLSAIIMEDTAKNDHKRFKVVTLGTGNRCIFSSHLSLEGKAVNDSHAEVIARRAFMRYLYAQLESYSIDKPSIFVTAGDGKVRVKPSIAFHLYISSCPCGDASLFASRNQTSSKNEEHLPDSAAPIFNSSCQGLLRTKIEAGEGSIPVDRGCIQTWIGLQFGSRLRTMSCSDKILKWNVLGLQGSLLSFFTHPIYLSSIIIAKEISNYCAAMEAHNLVSMETGGIAVTGDNFKFGHISRALYYRLNPSSDEEFDMDLPPGYRANCPQIIHSDLLASQSETEKSTPQTAIWTHGDYKAQVIDGTSGKQLEEDAEPALISKHELFASFKNLTSSFSTTSDLNTETYYNAKWQSGTYQSAKALLYERLEALGHGTWVKKPLELEYFS